MDTLTEPLPPATMIMTFHGEDVYAHKSLLGLERIREYSASHKHRVDLICILDNANATTTQIVKNHISRHGKSHDQVIEAANGSLSASRNIGIDHARTEYAGFLDGDDFFSANWAYEASLMQNRSRKSILCMPGHVVSFGRHIAMQTITPSEHIARAQMMNTHYWVSSAFSQTAIFKQHPYNEKIGKQTKFAFEDWDFNLRCVDAGIEITAVADTYLFYRRRENSMLQEHLQYGSLIPPSDFFANLRL